MKDDLYNELITYIEEMDKDIISYNYKNSLFNKDELMDIILDMYTNPDQRFFNRVSAVFESSKRFSYSSNKKRIFNKTYYGFFLPFYGILMAYNYQKNNYDNFDCIVGELGELEQFDLGFEWFYSFFKYRYECVKNLVSREDYKDKPMLRNFIRYYMHYSHLGLYEMPLTLINRIFQDIEKYKRTKLFDNIDITGIVDCVIDYDDKRSASAFSPDLYYSEILLFKNRLRYVNEKIVELEDYSVFREEIFKMISKLSTGLFLSLNRDGEKDFFETCMNIVFDSDSYHELVSKLNYLKKVGECANYGFSVSALDIIKMLNDSKHKDSYCGEVVSYPQNTMNMMKKPKKITDRMKEIYSRIDPSISYDFIDFVKWDASSIEGMNLSLGEKIKSEKLLVTRVKNKVKNKFDDFCCYIGGLNG